MLWTLQKYIFREMGKTFVLTAVGLIGVVSLGGGVLNMIELEGASALQWLRIMALVLPVSAALTLPVAALYSATATYGRMSADNEFVACRSGGINIHVLFLPTVVFSLLSAVCSFVFINFVIPGMIMNIDRFMGADLARILRQQLASPRRLSLNRDKYRIYSDNSELVEEQAEATNAAAGRLRLSGVAFMESDQGKWLRFGTARGVEIGFDARDGRPTAEADMYDVCLYDCKRGQWFEFQHEGIEAFPLPRSIPLKAKWLNLGDLLQYRRQPVLFPEVERNLAELRAAIAGAVFYEDIIQQFKTGYSARFGDERTVYTIKAGVLTPGADDLRPIFSGGVTITETRPDTTRTVRATEAGLLVEPGRRGRGPSVQLTATGDVSIEDSRQPGVVIRRMREKLDPVLVPDAVRKRAGEFTDTVLLDAEAAGLKLGDWVEQARVKTITKVDNLKRDILSELHARTTFSVSAFVLVLLGAALGIVFRGAHVLTAFGISFVPSLFVITMIIMGKQIIDRPGMAAVGVGLMWSGIAVVALVDVVVMTRVLRR